MKFFPNTKKIISQHLFIRARRQSRALPVRGSALVYALIVLSLVLITTLSLSDISVIERKTSGATSNSVAAFQVADTGVEVVLKKIYKGDSSGTPYTDINALAQDLEGAGGSTGTCTNGLVNVTLDIGQYRIAFRNKNNDIIACDNSDWNDPTQEDEVVNSIISQGSYRGTVRTVEVAVYLGS